MCDERKRARGREKRAWVSERIQRKKQVRDGWIQLVKRPRRPSVTHRIGRDSLTCSPFFSTLAQTAGEGAWGMLDVAYYPNREMPANGLNCASHFDPGLFSLSVFSSASGTSLSLI